MNKSNYRQEIAVEDSVTPVRVHGWAIRRRDGGITTSSEGWARDVHEMTGLPLLRFDVAAGAWAEVNQ